MTRIRTVVFVATVTWLAAYLLDPQSGRRRRAILRDRTAAILRRARRRAERQQRHVSGKLEGIGHQADLSRRETPPPDDVTLARKLETVLFRDPAVPKGNINIAVVNGIVELRGEVDQPEMIRQLERSALDVAGVQGVDNRLHLPDTPVSEP
jgi:BON domain